MAKIKHETQVGDFHHKASKGSESTVLSNGGSTEGQPSGALAKVSDLIYFTNVL